MSIPITEDPKTWTKRKNLGRHAKKPVGKKYRVVQVGTSTHFDKSTTVRVTGRKDYHWKWVARLSMLFHTGESVLGVTQYRCELVYIEDLDPEPYVHSCWDDGTCTELGKRHVSKQFNDDFRPREKYYHTEYYYGESKKWWTRD